MFSPMQRNRPAKVTALEVQSLQVRGQFIPLSGQHNERSNKNFATMAYAQQVVSWLIVG